MVKRSIYFFCLSLIFLFFASITQAQTVNNIFSIEAGEDKNVLVERPVVFSANTDQVIENTSFTWDFGDGSIANGVEVTHTFANPGVYRVSLSAINGNLMAEDEIIVNVEKDIVMLITDESLSTELLEELQEKSSSVGILLVPIIIPKQDTDYLSESLLIQAIVENRSDIRQARNIVIWTSGSYGLNALIGASQELAKGADIKSLGFNQKGIYVLTGENLKVTSRLAQNVYNLLLPKNMMVVDAGGYEEVIPRLDSESITYQLKENNQSYQILGAHTQRPLHTLKLWNFLSYIIDYMVNNGVSINTIYLILILPIIATIIAFSRQIIGIKAFGMYAPSLVAVSFIATGIKYGLALFAMVLIIGTVGRLVARKIRLMYMPRMSLVLSIVSFSVLGMFFVGALFNKTGIISISIFPILIMVIITEKFLEAQIELGSKTAFKLVAETLILALVSYYLATWESLRILIIGYPEIILLTFLINYALGKWTGLRLLELYRFRKVIQNVELPEKK